jgi:hypothetical protein
LGRLILDLKPDVVVHIGDHWDMASLSGHSSKMELEGKKYMADIEAGVEALDMIDWPTRRAKKKRPRKVFCMGNHEARIDRLVEQQPVLEGKVSDADLQLLDYGWEVNGFLTPVVVDGIVYSHYFVSGVMGKPIGGVHSARSLLSKQHMSTTQGHSHLLDYSLTNRADGRRIQGLVCGVFQDYRTTWNNNQSESQWWPGLVIKRNVENGVYDPQFVSIQALKKEYD